MENVIFSECLINLRGKLQKMYPKGWSPGFALLNHIHLCFMATVAVICCWNTACRSESWDWLSKCFQISELWDTVIHVFSSLLIGISVFLLSLFMSYFLLDASLSPYLLHVPWLAAGFDEVQGASLFFGVCLPVATGFFFFFFCRSQFLQP